MKQRMTRKFNSLNSAVVLASALVLLAAPITSMAGSFKLDGIKAAPDMYTESFSAGWFNGHNGDNYPESGSFMSTVHYGTGTDIAEVGTSTEATEYSWLFLEVPLEAKNMIWGESVFTAQDKIDYGKNGFDFKGATHSEKVIFGESGKEITINFGGRFDRDDGTPSGNPTEGKDGIVDNGSSLTILDVRDSVDFLVGSGQCGTSGNADTTCEARTRTMSFEIKFAALSDQQKTNLFAGITSNELDFHLSPDRVADVSQVPVPAAFWLFGSALIGFIGFSRRTNLS